MNAVLTSSVAADQMKHYDAIRRKNAESAYSRNVQYNGQNQKTVEHLEALLLGKKEPGEVQASGKGQPDLPKQLEFQKLSGGQAKQIALPVGKTLEETIDIWRGVRAEAISEPEPTTADYQLAAKASANIMRTEAKIALHNMAKTLNEASMSQSASMELPIRPTNWTSLMQNRFEKAISSYLFQNSMKQNGYQLEKPGIYKSA